MSNELSLFAKGGLPTVDMTHYKASVKAAEQALKATSGALPFLRMGKDGGWLYGAENTDVEDDSLWAINPFSMSMGFIAWGAEGSKDEGTVVGEVMALLTEPPVQRGTLQDVGAEWSPCVAFDLMCLTGADKGKLVRYKSNSVGGKRAFADMLQLVSAAMDDGSGKVVPIVTLDADSYPHKKYGKIYTPVFEVKKWVMPSDGDLGAQQEEKAAPAEDDGVVRRRRR